MMHIPDGYLNVSTQITTGLLSATGLGYAIYNLRKTLQPKQIPLIGLTSAFIFAAQMLNFPVLAGTSGHLIGAVLCAVLLGPVTSVLIMSSVLILQCFLFNDGGVTALGANIFNMAIVAPFAGYGVYSLLMRFSAGGLFSRLFSISVAAWISTVAASATCALQLAVSGTAELKLVLPAMTIIHMLIGIGEAVITTMILSYIYKAKPALLEKDAVPPASSFIYSLLAFTGLLIFIAPFASPLPDGLEKVSEGLGFAGKGTTAIINAPLADYSAPGIGSGYLSTITAGAIGLMFILLISLVLAKSLSSRKTEHGN